VWSADDLGQRLASEAGGRRGQLWQESLERLYDLARGGLRDDDLDRTVRLRQRTLASM
jgi:hypothetical protein